MPVALITGASSGLGKEFAFKLAQLNYDLVLTARSTLTLRELGRQLERAYPVSITVITADLASHGAVESLVKQLDDLNIIPDVLINNAGFGIAGEFISQDLGHVNEMLHVNVISLTELTHQIGSRMKDSGRGRILLVSSMAAHMPTPLLAAYGASKAYIQSLGEALNVELGPTVTVTVLSPGLMNTGFNDAAGYQPPPGLEDTILPTSEVANIGLTALAQGKSSVIAGRRNNFNFQLSRLFSKHRLATRIYRSKRM